MRQSQISATGTTWERKKTKVESNKTTTSWPENYQPVSSQCKRGGPMVEGFANGVIWRGGERAYFWYLPKASFGRFFVRKVFLPKIGSKWLGKPDA